MQVAEVVRAVDKPELLVASGRVENLLVRRQHNECREANLGVNGNDVGLGVLHGSRAGIRMDRRRPRNHPSAAEQKTAHSSTTAQFRQHWFLLWKVGSHSRNS